VTKLESMIENVQTELEEAIVLLRQIVGDTSGDTK